MKKKPTVLELVITGLLSLPFGACNETRFSSSPHQTPSNPESPEGEGKDLKSPTDEDKNSTDHDDTDRSDPVVQVPPLGRGPNGEDSNGQSSNGQESSSSEDSNGEEFNGEFLSGQGRSDQDDPDREIPDAGQEFALAALCDGNSQLPDEVKISGNDQISMKIEGDFCYPKNEAVAEFALNLVFVLDVSGSMADNDPLDQGSCGRYESVQAIVSKVKDSLKAGTSAQISAVSFDASANVLIQPIDIFKFSSTTYKGEICAASGGTNYEGAFNKASTLIPNDQSKSAVFFITDGLPTKKDSNNLAPAAAGKAAAQRLRTSHAGLEMYTVFLGNEDGSGIVLDGSEVKDPLNYLQELTGDAERVKVVATANSLADSIVTFKLPDPLRANIAEATLIISTQGEADREIELARLDPLSGDIEKWKIASGAFTPPMKQGDAVISAVKIRFKVGGKMEERTLATIDFLQR